MLKNKPISLLLFLKSDTIIFFRRCLGETKDQLEDRVKDHKESYRTGSTEKSAIADHAWKEHHPAA